MDNGRVLPGNTVINVCLSDGEVYCVGLFPIGLVFLSRLVIAKLLKYNLRSLPISHISYTTLSGNSSGIPFFLILKE